MTKRDRFHSNIAWAKERLDEMDASLDILHRQAGKAKTTALESVDRSIQDLRRRRDAFRQAMKIAFEAGATQWADHKTRLESQWNDFEAELNRTMETFGAQVANRQMMFRDLVAAQRNAWRNTAKTVQSFTTGFAHDCEVEIKQAIQTMKANELKAEERLKDIKEAGADSWLTMKGALAESRSAFDRSIKACEKAFERTTKTGAESKPKNRQSR